MKLYGFWRSGAAWRVRIALNLKGVPYEQVSVHLMRNGGEQMTSEYRAINPQARVPSLVLDDGRVLVQSPAILEWIEETWPTPPLLPKDLVLRAHIRGVCNIIGADTHPLTNAAGTLKVLKSQFGADEAAILKWLTHWTQQGFGAVEALIGDGPYCFGDAVTMADLYVVPQYFAAKRFNVPVDGFPKLARVVEACGKLDAFRRAAPDQQPDKE